MAKLSIVTAVKVAPEGEWVAPGGDMDDIEFRTVGFTDAYTDAVAAKQRRLAKAYEGEIGRVPVKLLRDANTEALLQHCVSGIRNLEGADGQPVTWEQAKEMARDPQFKPLVEGMFAATSMLSRMRQADLQDAEGNSAASSGTSSNGAVTAS